MTATQTLTACSSRTRKIFTIRVLLASFLVVSLPALAQDPSQTTMTGAVMSYTKRVARRDAKITVEAERRAGGFHLLRPGHQAPRRWSDDRRRSAEEKQGDKTEAIHADPPRPLWTRS